MVIQVDKSTGDNEETRDSNSRQVKITQVDILADVVKTMDKHGISAGNLEAIGLLVGFEDTVFPERIFISKYMPIAVGKAEEVEFAEVHYKIYEAMELDDNLGEYIVGWFHTHPGYGIFLSPTDLHTHYYSFQARNPKAIAIVLDPTLRTFIHTQLDSKEPLSDFAGFQVEIPESGGKYFTARELQINVARSFDYIEEKRQELEQNAGSAKKTRKFPFRKG